MYTLPTTELEHAQLSSEISRLKDTRTTQSEMIEEMNKRLQWAIDQNIDDPATTYWKKNSLIPIEDSGYIDTSIEDDRTIEDDSSIEEIDLLKR